MGLTINQANRCVMARLMRRGKLYWKYFYFRDYPTVAAAKRAAKAWLKEVEPTLPPPASMKGKKTARNASGVVGVNYTERPVQKRGRTYLSRRWVARWPRCRLNGGMSWGVQHYGYKDAFVLAVLSREMESVDRQRIVDTFNRMRSTPKYAQILSRLRQKSNT